MVRRTGIAEDDRGSRDSGFAVEAVGISKTFRLPHEQISTIKEHVLHPLRRTTYELQEAVADVSFEIPHGEMFGIIGPNGSGKSTLLKILAGIYRQDAGTVRMNGILSPFIELGGGFNVELTGRDNIRINGTLLGLTRRELGERFDSILEFAELERFVDQKLKNYSSGMQVRLAYSIAIQVRFDILMLDEVLAVGDLEFQQKCFETFRQMRKDGKTIIFVSHDLKSVSDFCDRALLLEHGRMKAIGPAAQVIAEYESEVSEQLHHEPTTWDDVESLPSSR
jgi:ABC-type polysaccharide/polyol phosphate transport system ATPase subunit